VTGQAVPDNSVHNLCHMFTSVHQEEDMLTRGKYKGLLSVRASDLGRSLDRVSPALPSQDDGAKKLQRRHNAVDSPALTVKHVHRWVSVHFGQEVVGVLCCAGPHAPEMARQKYWSRHDETVQQTRKAAVIFPLHKADSQTLHGLAQCC